MTKHTDKDLDATAVHVKALGKILDAHTAEYIVRAVKSYEDMVDMLKNLKSTLLMMEQYEALPVPAILCKNIKRIGFVLAKATG